MPEPLMNLEPGHVCPFCNRPIPTGFYYVVRDVPQLRGMDVAGGTMQPLSMGLVTKRCHPNCAQLEDIVS